MAMLVYADTDGVEHSFTVGPEPITVGRATGCTIRSGDPRVSRNHARFYLDANGTLHVEDLGSSNGVFVGPHKVTHSPVPPDEIVLVGSIAFRLVVPPPPQAYQQVDWAQPATQPAAHEWSPPAPQAAPPPPPQAAPPPPAPQAAPPPPAPQPVQDTSALDAERKARQAAEEERDAYGARMAELHQEVRDLKQKLTDKDKRLSELPQYSGEIDLRVGRISDLEDQLKGAEGQIRALEEQLATARADLTAAEERIVSEIAAHEQRSSAELASRVEELEVSRADLIKAEERIVELTRKVSELEEKLGRF